MIKYKKGVTLIELIVVIAIISILAAILIPTVSASIHRSQQATFISNIATMELIVSEYIINRTSPPNTNPRNPGTMSDEQWNQYAREQLNAFVTGGWPTSTPWGGFYTYRAYAASGQPGRTDERTVRKWIQINTGQRITEIVGNEPFEIIMIRFVNPANEEGFNKALEVLRDSRFSNRVFRFQEEFNIGILVRP